MWKLRELIEVTNLLYLTIDLNSNKFLKNNKINYPKELGRV